MLTSRTNAGHEHSAWGWGSRGGGCCFSPVIIGWVDKRGGGGYARGVALDLDIYIYLRIVFENTNFIPRLGNFLVLTSSCVSCMCLCVYILTQKSEIN